MSKSLPVIFGLPTTFTCDYLCPSKPAAYQSTTWFSWFEIDGNPESFSWYSNFFVLIPDLVPAANYCFCVPWSRGSALTHNIALLTRFCSFPFSNLQIHFFYASFPPIRPPFISFTTPNFAPKCGPWLTHTIAVVCSDPSFCSLDNTSKLSHEL